MSTAHVASATPNLLSRILTRLGDALFQDAWTQEQRAMERYLSQAQNHADLEQRQRTWDRERRRNANFAGF